MLVIPTYFPDSETPECTRQQVTELKSTNHFWITIITLSVAHPVCHFTFTTCLVYVSTLCTVGFCFCICRYGFSCVYCIVFHWLDSPHCDLLWFTVIFCAILSIDHKVVLNLTWLDMLNTSADVKFSQIKHLCKLSLSDTGIAVFSERLCRLCSGSSELKTARRASTRQRSCSKVGGSWWWRTVEKILTLHDTYTRLQCLVKTARTSTSWRYTRSSTSTLDSISVSVPTMPAILSVAPTSPSFHVSIVLYAYYGWRLGVVVSVVGRINEVNQHRARLVHDGWPLCG